MNKKYVITLLASFGCLAASSSYSDITSRVLILLSLLNCMMVESVLHHWRAIV